MQSQIDFSKVISAFGENGNLEIGNILWDMAAETVKKELKAIRSAMKKQGLEDSILANFRMSHIDVAFVVGVLFGKRFDFSKTEVAPILAQLERAIDEMGGFKIPEETGIKQAA